MESSNDILGVPVSAAAEVATEVKKSKGNRISLAQIIRLGDWILKQAECRFISMAEAETMASDELGFRVTGYSIREAWIAQGRNPDKILKPATTMEERVSILEGNVAKLFAGLSVVSSSISDRLEDKQPSVPINEVDIVRCESHESSQLVLNGEVIVQGEYDMRAAELLARRLGCEVTKVVLSDEDYEKTFA